MILYYRRHDNETAQYATDPKFTNIVATLPVSLGTPVAARKMTLKKIVGQAVELRRIKNN